MVLTTAVGRFLRRLSIVGVIVPWKNSWFGAVYAFAPFPENLNMRGFVVALLALFAVAGQVASYQFRAPSVFQRAQKAVTSGVVAASVFVAPAALVVLGPPSSPWVEVAHADVRAQQKKTYFRFVPKLIVGRDFYKGELKAAIDKENWPVVQKLFEEYVTRTNKESGSVEATDTYVKQNLIRPMVVFSGSFAERGSSDKQRSLLEQEQKFEAAMALLDGSVNDKAGGLFGTGAVKAPTGAARKTQALQAWNDGKAALNAYISIANEVCTPPLFVVTGWLF